ncbi:MAG: trypsin-like peptidase domain-containing protein [Victivallales bacterium]|nr:trypsin-like peptidase domain-containing protein [Victivallales bacterium]
MNATKNMKTENSSSQLKENVNMNADNEHSQDLMAFAQTFTDSCTTASNKRPSKDKPKSPNTLETLSDNQLNAVVRVDMVITEPNFRLPWQSSNPMQASGSGVVIAGHRILTNAHNVANTTYITVRRQDQDTEFEAKVFAVDHACDLALLQVKDEEAFFKGIVPLELGDTPPIQSEVQVAGYPVGGAGLSITQGIISRIEEVPYAHSGEKLLGAQLDAAINSGNSGGPVLRDGKIVGIAFQELRRRQCIGYMIPPVIIRHFLKDLENGKIDSFGSLPFSFLELNNPDTRRFLKMKPKQTGVLIYKLQKTAEKNSLRVNDVLLNVDGHPISNLGAVRQAGQKPRSILSYYREKQLGEPIKFGVLRDGREMTVQLQVQKGEPLVPKRLFDMVPEYFILGSLVFAPLTGNLLQTDDFDFGFNPNPPLQNRGVLENFVDQIAEKPGDQVVLLQEVLGDSVTVGYGNSQIMQPVVKVNGHRIRNLRQLVKVVEAAKGTSITFSLHNGMPLTLDLQHLREATPRVLRLYRIANDRNLNPAS